LGLVDGRDWEKTEAHLLFYPLTFKYSDLKHDATVAYIAKCECS